MGKSVLILGWHASAVDFSKWPGLNAEKLERTLADSISKLNDQGFEAEDLMLKSADTAADDVKAKLATKAYDVVLIGAGVRKDDDSFLTFEKLINALHENAPQAKICFNTNPADTTDAVLRWT